MLNSLSGINGIGQRHGGCRRIDSCGRFWLFRWQHSLSARLARRATRRRPFSRLKGARCAARNAAMSGRPRRWRSPRLRRQGSRSSPRRLALRRPYRRQPLPRPRPSRSRRRSITAMGGFAGMRPRPRPNRASPSERRRHRLPRSQPDADFGSDEDLAAQVERMNAEAAMAAEGVLPDEKPSGGGIFARLKSKRAPAPGQAAARASRASPRSPSVPPSEAELAALAAGEPPPAEAPSRVVAMGWLGLILFVALILGILVFAKGTVLSVLPGAQRLYGMFGGSSAASGLTFEGVRYGWANEGGQTVLEIQGDVVNSSASPVAVPQVVIALRDEKGTRSRSGRPRPAPTSLPPASMRPSCGRFPRRRAMSAASRCASPRPT